MEAVAVVECKMKQNLQIKGMHCSSCARLIENALKEKGVTAKIDFKNGNAEIVYNEEKINIDKIISIIEKEGYRALL